MMHDTSSGCIVLYDNHMVLAAGDLTADRPDVDDVMSPAILLKVCLGVSSIKFESLTLQ